jgi:Ala-tRNA(Pro) deacylase
MEKCAAVSEVLGVTICKNLFLCNRQKTKFYLLAMDPSKPFHTKDLSKQIGSSRLSFAPEEMLWELLRCTPGSATALGLMHDTENQVQLVIDKAVLQGEYVGCHPLVNTTSLRIRTADLEGIILPALGHTPIIVDLPDVVDEA